MFYICVYDKTTGRMWYEYYDKWSDVLKREDKLKYSKKLYTSSKGRTDKNA